MKLAADFVVEAVTDRRCEEMQHDLMLRFAIERALITIGEALNQLHHSAPQIAEQIGDWKKVIGFRHILVHGYKFLDENIVWDIATVDVPVLIQQLTQLLSDD